MLKFKFFFSLFFVSAIILSISSCNDDEDDPMEIECNYDETDSIVGSQYICYIDSSFTGTYCCLEGTIIVSGGDTEVYEIDNNYEIIDVEWNVSDGITIKSQGTSSISVTFSENFTTGAIAANIDGLNRTCTAEICISTGI